MKPKKQYKRMFIEDNFINNPLTNPEFNSVSRIDWDKSQQPKEFTSQGGGYFPESVRQSGNSEIGKSEEYPPADIKLLSKSKNIQYTRGFGDGYEKANEKIKCYDCGKTDCLNILCHSHLELLKQSIIKDFKKEFKEVIEDITSFTCECGCITFDNKKCRLCGKSPKYGEIDYNELITKLGLDKTNTHYIYDCNKEKELAGVEE